MAPAASRRRRRRAPAAPPKPEYKVIGRGRRSRSGAHAFDGFEIEDTRFLCGEYALVKSNLEDSPYIVAIERVLGSARGQDLQVEVRWFYRPEDVRAVLKRTKLNVLPNELFDSEYRQIIDPETIDGPAIIKYTAADASTTNQRRTFAGRGDTASDDEESDDEQTIPVFICRHKLLCDNHYNEPLQNPRLQRYTLSLLRRQSQLAQLDSSGATERKNAAADSEGDEDDEDHHLSAEESDAVLSAADSEDSDADVPTPRKKIAKRIAGTPKKTQTPQTADRSQPRRRGRPPAQRRTSSATGDSSPSTPAKRRASTTRGRNRRLTLRVQDTASAEPADASASSAACRALALNNLPTTNEALPCREIEFYEIYTFVQEKLHAKASGCLFVSGVPGTGKTATIRAVSRLLMAEREAGHLQPFQFLEINAMSLTSPAQAYVELYQKLGHHEDRVVAPAHACQMLQRHFTLPAPNKTTYVVLLDEVDYLYTKKQDVLYSLFDWPTHKHSRLILVAVANTMDLPERVMAHRVSSRLGLSRLSFAPYTREQLVQILKQRVAEVAAFEEPALELAARKVAAVSGDARRALGICTRAAEMAKERGAEKINIMCVSDALVELSASPILNAIQQASVYEKVSLLAALICFHQRGIEEADFADVLLQHTKLCNRFGMIPASSSVVAAVCSNLGASRVLMLEHGRYDMQRRARLNCSKDDVLFALRDDPMTQAVVQLLEAATTTRNAAPTVPQFDPEDNGDM